jgi:hypothetical protein
MEASVADTYRTRWSDDRLDDLKQSVDEVKAEVVGLRHGMVIGAIAICTMMFAGFGAILTLFATHF